MLKIWSAENRYIRERELWVAVMRAQAKAGVEIPREVIESYESKISFIDLEVISNREKLLKHDVKSRIEEFNHLAGYEYIHLGLTSRDVTENVEIELMKESLGLIRFKSISFLSALGKRIDEHKELPMVARTHNVPAQVTTLGKKFSVWADEEIFALKHLDELIERLPYRGVKGAVGTATDMSLLLEESISTFEEEFLPYFRESQVLSSSSQVYPRSIDFEVVASLVQLAAAANNVALNVRLLAGLGHAHESFSKSQVGSSAMPHKMNPRLSERINSLFSVLKGYLAMTENLVGDQWNEGDVSCSATRRASISGSFLVLDGILDTAIDVLNGLAVSEVSIANELNEEMPLIASSAYLMLMVEKGGSREAAHKLLGEALRNYRENGSNNREGLISALTSKTDSLLSEKDLLGVLSNPMQLTGLATSQCDLVLDEIDSLVAKVSGAAEYQPRQSI